MTATSEDRDLVQRLANMVRAGGLDAASDLLSSALDEAYHRGYLDAYGEGSGDAR